VPRRADLPRDYRIITVVELKRDGDDRAKAESQMADYMERIHQICAPGDSFKGFLVLKDTVIVYSYAGIGNRRSGSIVEEYSMFDPGNPWTRDLAGIAIRYWN
jgi:hypothetical protein